MSAIAVTVSLVVSICSMPGADVLKAKQREIESKIPGAKVSIRVDKKCLK